MRYSTSQAAKALGISPQRVRQLIAAGKLRGEKIGRAYTFTAGQIAKCKRLGPGRPKKG